MSLGVHGGGDFSVGFEWREVVQRRWRSDVEKRERTVLRLGATSGGGEKRAKPALLECGPG